MKEETGAFASGLRLDVEQAPAALRAQLAEGIHAFHARTVPLDARRFALALRDEAGGLAAGFCGALSWGWMFVEALWVAEAWRGQGLGAALLARAEAHARAEGCHSAWLDTFQARRFYEARGYTLFGELEDYPPGQSRSFLRKRL